MKSRTGILLAASIAAAAAVPAVLSFTAGGSRAEAAAPAAQPAAAQPAAIPALEGPWIVAVQPGHWKVDQLPDELARLRASTGAVYGNIREVDVNLAVSASLAARIIARGWKAVLVPADVPPGLRADAFIAIHADYGAPDRRGWKLAPPWRSSQASRALAAALAGAFSASPELVEDIGHVSVNMRGYFAFSPRRFEHAASPYTPASLIELGLLSNPSDRELLTGRPDFWAELIVSGLESYFKNRRRDETADLRPLELPRVAAAAGGALIRRSPSPEAEATGTLEAGAPVMPVDVSGDWYEIFDRRTWTTGWIRKEETSPANDAPGRTPGGT